MVSPDLPSLLFPVTTISHLAEVVYPYEQRINLLGWLCDRVVHMTYTEGGEELHVISLREATQHEVRYYFKAISDET